MGYFSSACECDGRTAACEAVRSGSIPERATKSKTLEPDGKATGCNPVQMGSTPIGVSRKEITQRRGEAGEGMKDRELRIEICEWKRKRKLDG